MYATTSLRDAYRRFKKDDDSLLYAFGQGEFFVFVMGDAHKVHAALPDVEIDETSSGYAQVRVHAQAFFQFAYRLSAKGVKVATVSRRVDARGKVAYALSEVLQQPAVS